MIPNDRMFGGKNVCCIEGKTYYKFVSDITKQNYSLQFEIKKINSPYKQGIAFDLSQKPLFEGDILLNDEKLELDARKKKIYVIDAEVYEGNTFELKVYNKQGYLLLSNASNFLLDHIDSIQKLAVSKNMNIAEVEKTCFTSGFSALNVYGNSFWVEPLAENRFRFHCNDHKMDDDYDDMIVEIAIAYL